MAAFCHSRTALAAGFFGQLLVPCITLESTGGLRLAARVIGQHAQCAARSWWHGRPGRVFCSVAAFCYSRTALAAVFFGQLLVPSITLERTGG